MAIKTWKELKLKYPRLVRPGFLFECHEGWVSIVDRYFEVVDREIPEDGVYDLRQVKEKWGTLRIYDSSYGETLSSVRAVTDAHRLVEARSLHTCEYCGNRGRYRDRFGYKTVTCDEHAFQNGAVAITEYPEPRDYRKTAEGWIVYNPDIDEFFITEAPGWE